MQFLFKDRITDMLDFAIKQGEFIISTTDNISSGNDFLASQYGMILYNSTCMCLQTIGETLKQIDNLTNRQFLHIKYPAVPWRNIFALRNIISHEYASTDPEEIFNIIHSDLPPLICTIGDILTDIDANMHDGLFMSIQQQHTPTQ